MYKPKILLADDDLEFIAEVRELLKDQCELTVAIRASQLVEHLETNKFDLLLMDVWFNDQRSGALHMASNAKEYYPDMKVVLITFSGPAELAKYVQEYGVDEGLRKACDEWPQNLLGLLSRYFQ